MAKRYFGINSLAGLTRFSTLVTEATTAGKFDSSYVSNAVVVPLGNDYASINAPFMDGSSSITGSFWLRFDLHTGYTSNNGVVTMFSGGVNAYRLFWNPTANITVQYWNTGTNSWVNWGSSAASPTQNILNTIVMHVVPNVSHELFIAGTSVASSAVVPTNGVSSVDEFRFGGVTSGGAVGSYFSQIMCADYDIRDAHLMAAAINGNSTANTSGTGTYTDVNEAVLDESTAVVLAAAGKKGFTHSAITVPSTMSIAGRVINVRGRVGGGVVTDGKVGVRSGSTNYSSSGLSLTSGYSPRRYIAESDPATAAAWSQTSFNNAEDYVEAA
jgi:hypothetical protein